MKEKRALYLLSFLIIFSPLPLGSVLCWSRYLLLFLVALTAYLLYPQELELPQYPEIYYSKYLFIGFSIFLFFQLFPLPSFLLKLLSPNTSALLKIVGLKPAFHPISVIPVQTLIYVIGFFPYAFLFLALWRRKWHSKEIDLIFASFIASGLLQGIFAFLKYATKTQYFFLFFYQRPPSQFATGTLVNPDHFSAMMEMLLPLSIAYIILRSQEKGFFNYLNSPGLLAIVAPLFIFGTSLISGSRAGIISLIIGFLVVFELILYRQFHRKKRFLKGVFAVLVFSTLFVGGIITYRKFLHVEQRPEIWHTTMKIFKDFPIFGAGFGTYPSVAELYKTVDMGGVIITHAHNEYLETLADGGLLGTAFLLLPLLLLLYWNLKRWDRRRNPRVKILNAGLYAAIAAIGLHSFFDFPLRIPSNMLYAVIIFALSMALVEYGRRK